MAIMDFLVVSGFIGNIELAHRVYHQFHSLVWLFRGVSPNTSGGGGGTNESVTFRPLRFRLAQVRLFNISPN